MISTEGFSIDATGVVSEAILFGDSQRDSLPVRWVQRRSSLGEFGWAQWAGVRLVISNWGWRLSVADRTQCTALRPSRVKITAAVQKRLLSNDVGAKNDVKSFAMVLYN
jgi:hypothetical protein